MNDLKMTTAGDYMKPQHRGVIEALEDVGLNGLQEIYGIKASQNPEYPNLYVLNYDQIDSAKLKDHPVVKQCRSLVVEYTDLSWHIVSRSFDRFFNEGEVDHDYNVCQLTAREKVDGSLVSVFKYNGVWLYRTKSMLMPSEEMKMVSGRSWKDLIESVLIGPFLLDNFTFIFEVVSRDNRVVTRYDDDAAYLLAARNNTTGLYLSQDELKDVYRQLAKRSSKVFMPRVFQFDTMHHVLESAKSLPNLEEGYVMYDLSNTPVLKVKSPAYVAAHRLRGESVLTPKRMIEMIQIGEHEEYLAIFPEDAKEFDFWISEYNNSIDDIYSIWYDQLRHITDQKEYALEVMKNWPKYQGFLFRLKKDPAASVDKMFRETSSSKLVELLSDD